MPEAFYINPYNNGDILGTAELEYFLQQVNIEAKPFYFTPSSNIDIIERLIVNLKFAYERAEQDSNDKIEWLDEFLFLIRNRS